MKKTYGWIIGLILLGFVLAGIFLSIAPEEIAVHYNFRGEVDRWGSPYEFLLMPFMNLFFGIGMILLARHEGKQGRGMNEKVVSIMTALVLVMFNLIWVFFMWIAVDLRESGDAIGELPGKLLVLLLAASFVPLGNLMPKAQRNSIFGLRTKWSMADDWCWQQSQRIGGFMLVICGIAGVILAAILPAEWAGYALLGLILVMTVGCVYASYRIYMRSQNL